MTVPQITPLPTPPQRNDPANFAARADPFLAAMPPFAAQVNMTVTYFNDNIPLLNQAVGAAADAQTSKQAAAASAATATGAATTATTQATIAQQNAASSNAYRQQAAASATAAAGSATAAQTAAATAQAIVWQGTTGYPKIRPSLLLDFANSKTVDPRITCTRASTALRTAEKGFLRKAEVNEPRIDHDPVTVECKGLLIEESQTNLLTYSEQFDNAAWNKTRSTITSNAATAPDGTLTADKLVENTENNSHAITQPLTINNATLYTLSIFVKKAERSWVRLSTGNTGFSAVYAWFDLASGAVGTQFGSPLAKIEPLGDGWYRISISALSIGTTGSLVVYTALSDNSTAYTGDGNSGVYIWGAQLEAGSLPTSYIPTPATFTSRASVGTYTDSTGLLKTAAINEPRYDHGLVDGVWVPKGLLLEPQRTNLLTYSDQFDNAAWVKTNATISSNAVVAPDGTLTADRLIESNSTGPHNVYQFKTASSGQVTFSCYVKANGRTVVELTSYESSVPSNPVTVRFNLTSGTFVTKTGLTTSYRIKSVGNGWFRCEASGISAGTTTSWSIGLINGTANNYPGDGTSGIYIWGAQLEEIPAGQSPESSSYIKTEATAVTRSADISTSSAVTRAADAATLPIGDWHSRYAGTWLVKAAVRSGEPVITAGDITITADTDAEKTYALAYDTAKNAANVQLGKGTFKQVTYYPKKLLTNEIAALQA